MKKSLKVLTLLFFMPCLMANALGPSNYYSDYTSLRVEYVSSEQVGEEYRHTYHISNMGYGYVDNISIRDGEGEEEHHVYLNWENMSDIFADALLGPGSSEDFTFTTSYSVIDTSSNISYSARAYKSGNSFNINLVKGIKYIGPNNNEYSNFSYIYEIEFKNSYNRDAIFHLDYDGSDYYVVCSTSGGYEHRLYTKQELDLEKLSVKDFFLIEPHQAFKIDDSAFERAMIIFLVGFLFLASLIVFPAVFIPAMVRRSRRNRAKAAKK